MTHIERATLRNIANFAFDAADRQAARAKLDAAQNVFERNRNAWRAEAAFALRSGFTVFEIATRKRVIPWDGCLTAWKL